MIILSLCLQKENDELININTSEFMDEVPGPGEYFYFITSLENDTLESFNSDKFSVAVGSKKILQVNVESKVITPTIS